jgi:type IX secretion system substrate protein/PKD domain-containing protein
LQQIAAQTVLTNPAQWNIDTIWPTASFTYSLENDSVYFEDLSSNADQYLWRFGDGETDTVANPSHHYLQNGLYVVKQFVSHRCRIDSTAQVVNYVASNIVDKKLPHFRVYPNPVKDILKIELSKPDGFVLQRIELFNLNGVLVLSKNCNGSHTVPVSVDLSGVEAGTFLLRLQGAEGVYEQRIVHQ